ncbi:putative DJ-1 family protein [Vibrio nigripulchritudo MADA3029]|uniref:DJ-1 family protein n=1 Tax=Vibrio nigripulchritudo SOn1 TaxID=1238450 RepID=A0AAV2VVA2_9VIBR|nr:DJ-1 family glyoxalase III [Vibrio nigripulchritudo]CCN47100.1 putative DJ-1 family protein [Vibrio nigripulchritudo MADA3020]CCN51043.1 putative DJ-1 family protein [Vibrio nigripulchritudo MADA3021]CCN60562.1 putative DJ-1 family protein [Vibrio nigripulchritudo MADA3029]CCN72935.1 putative DJ-1 family protein [Vibrio nigripulchritudo SFn118]CCO48318.1 putative DJ-1 family protein [Vibrio nigripulchritudo SOn1]
MSFKVLVPIAPGTEEMEAVTIIDIMVRAGYDVTIASVDPEGSLTMKASRGVILTADCKLVEVADEQFDVIALPGGVPGSETFRDSVLLIEMLKQHMYEGRWMAAICAAPALVLQTHDLYPEAIMTCHPSFEKHIPEAQWRVKRVVTDVIHKLITSQGPGSALEFAMEIVIRLSGKPHAWSVAEPMVPVPQLHFHEMGK